jgi:hypothetical protein
MIIDPKISIFLCVTLAFSNINPNTLAVYTLYWNRAI